MKVQLTFLFLFGVFLGFSQDKMIHIVNNEDGEGVAFARVLFSNIDVFGEADGQGFIAVTANQISYGKVKISALGFETLEVQLTFSSSDTLQLKLKHKHLELDEVEIHSVIGETQATNVVSVEVHSLESLNDIENTSLGESLDRINGVQVTTIGKGIFKPVIRGLSGMRVVTYIDGLRIENQQWGADHGIGAESNGIQGVEVVKGPASLLYGADAVGGVVYFSDEPFTQNDNYEITLKSKFESNTLGSTSDIGLKFAKKAFKINVFGSYSNHADYQLASGEYIKNSRFSNGNASVVLGYHKKKWASKLRYNFIQRSMGIPGHSHDSIVLLENLVSNNQVRAEGLPVQKVLSHYVYWENKWFQDNGSIKLSVGNTNNSLSEFEEKVTVAGIKINLNNSFLNFIWNRKFGKGKLFLGSQMMYGFSDNAPEAEEVLLPDNRQLDAGAFAVYSHDIKSWKVQVGARYDFRFLNANPGLTNNFQKSFHGFNFSLGSGYYGDKFEFRINLSSGSRPPHLSELLADGPHHGSNRYELGDANLKTENVYQADASFKLLFDHVELFVNPFYSFMTNYVYLNPTDSLINGYKVFEYTQSNMAHLFGGELGIHWHPHFAHWLHWETNFSYVHTLDGYGNGFPFTPPARISNTLKFEFKFKKVISDFNAVIRYSYNANQKNVAQDENTSKGYHLLDLGLSLKFKTKHPITLKTGVKNMLNSDYIPHLSNLRSLNVPNPGYNIYIGLHVQFNKNKR